MGGAQLHTPQSVFQHMMGQQTAPHEAEQWLQMPQVPQFSMPWSISSLQQPDLVRFTGEQPQPKGPFLHQKRKLEMPDLVDTRCTKQFITEEKMAAHFRDLHISPFAQKAEMSSTSVIPPHDEFDAQQDLEMDDGSSITDLSNLTRSPTKLVLSDEIKRLQEEPLLPSSLLSKLERPSMALVLWEPPNKYLRTLQTPRNTPTPVPGVSNDSNNNNNNEEGNNNNNETMLDLNQVFPNQNNVPLYEPMDL